MYESILKSLYQYNIKIIVNNKMFKIIFEVKGRGNVPSCPSPNVHAPWQTTKTAPDYYELTVVEMSISSNSNER